MTTNKLTPSEEFVWQYINDNVTKIPAMSIVQLSEKSNVSTATIVRTMKKMGFEGYTSFRHTLKSSTNSNEEWNFELIDVADQNIRRAIEKNEQETLLTIKQVDSTTIEDAVQKISSSRKVIIFARGLSTYVAEEMMLKFLVLNKYCETYSDPNIIRIKSRNIHEDDVVIFISLSGETEELVEASDNCLRNETTTITITTSKHSSLAKNSTLLFLGFKASDSFIPEFEVKSRLPLSILTRIISDAYAVRINDDFN
ncbi:MurR/RpiR family transcriptional regulator [Ruoffia sp. FAM 24228]|uniref:MurR/RpiR family transcriptional regulator n=1 Tax=unclassified Ruoffia TaxID=2862149 RepID=UPI0038887041